MSGIEISPFEDLYSLMTSDMDQFAQVRVKFNKLEDAEDKYGKLLSYKTALESQKTLSLELALECDLTMGDTTMGNLCFCEKSEEEKYEMAMEAISLGLAAMLAAMAGAVVAIITYAIHHFFHRNDEKTTPAVNMVDEVKFKQDLLEHAKRCGAQTGPEATAELKAAIQGLEHYTKRKKAERNAGKKTVPAQEDYGAKPHVSDHVGYIPPLNALQMDHLSTGEYTQAMMGLLKTVDQSRPMSVLEDARHAYRELVQAAQRDIGKETNPDEHIPALKQHYMQLMANPRRVHAVLVQELNKLAAKQQQLDSGNVKFPEGINEALRTFSQAVSSPEIMAYARNRAEMAKELEYMREEAQKAQKMFAEESKKEKSGADTTFKGEIAKHGRELLKELHGLLAVVLKVDLLFQRYWKSLDVSAKYLAHAVSTVRWNMSLKLADKGLSRQQIAQQNDIKQMDGIVQSLEKFRTRAKAA